MFWIFIGLIAGALIIADAIQKKARLEIIRAAVEKGQPLDSALVDKLLKSEEDAASKTPNKVLPKNPMRLVTGLQIAAIMVSSVAGGVTLIAFLTAEEKSDGFGVATLFACISLGLYLSSILVRSRVRARAAVENGQPQDPALLGRLHSDENWADEAGKASSRNPMRPVTGLQIGAIMVSSVAAGAALIALLFVEEKKSDGFAAAALFACVSLGLYLASRLVMSRAGKSDSMQ